MQVHVARHLRPESQTTYVFAATSADFTVADFAQFLGSNYDPHRGDDLLVESCSVHEPAQALDASAAPSSMAEPRPPAAPAAPMPGPLPRSNYVIYADGSCLGNPGAGGIGFVVLHNGANVLEQYRPWPAVTTNQVMELVAAEAALDAVAAGSDVTIRTDSQYVIGLMTLNWKVKANHERVATLRAAAARHRSVRFEHVRGHNGDRWNERADALAREGSAKSWSTTVARIA